MKRLIGLTLAVAGGIVFLWAGIHALTGNTATKIAITPDFSVTAITAGLVGTAVFTVGLLWVRD